LQYYSRPSRAHKVELTNEIAIELYVEITLVYYIFYYINIRVSGTRPGINNESAKLLVERSVRRDEG